MFSHLHHPLGFEINRRARLGDDFPGGIQQLHGTEFIGFDQLLQRRLDPLLGDTTPAPLRADDQPQRRGDVSGTVDQGRARGRRDPAMLDDLPGHDHGPAGQEQPINQFGPFEEVGVHARSARTAAYGRTWSGLSWFLAGAAVPGGGAPFTGRPSRKRLSSCSVNAFGANSALPRSVAESPANWDGAITMCGVKKMINSVFESVLDFLLNRFPRSGMSPSRGILLSELILLFCMSPPMMTGCPLGVTTTVSAERMLMTGALTPPPMGTD